MSGRAIFIFDPIFNFFFSLVPVPFFTVGFENAVQIALTCFVLTLRAVYGYACFFFFEIWKCPGGRNLYFWSDFSFFWWFSLVPVPLFFSVESENTVQIVLNGFVLTLSAI